MKFKSNRISSRKEINPYLSSSAIHFDALSRVLNTFISVILLFALAKFLGTDRFAELQLMYAAAGLSVWLSDFGLGNYLINVKVTKDANQIREVYSSRILSLTIFGLIISTLGALLINNFLFLFFIASLCDFICDSNIGFRQLIARNRKSLFVQPLKNLSQLLLICISSIVNIENNDSLIAFCIALPAITLIFYDTTRVGGFTKPKLIYHLKRSWKYLLQSGGNAILTLDFFIIANSSNLQTIAYLALARRILNAWSNLAQAAAPRLQYEIAEYRYISRESLRKLFALIGLILLGICLVAFFLGRIFSFFLDTSLTGEDTAFGQAVMFIGFIHIINNYANAILLGRMKFKEIALATYAGSISYLVILSLLSQSQNPYFFIPISSLFGACLTLSLFAGFIRREFVSR